MTAGKNLIAFLNMIAISELQEAVIKGSDNGYNVLFGSTPQHILTFPNYSDHPRVLNEKHNTTAAGRYQIIAHNYDHYKISLGLKDFGPLSQDAMAVQLIKECHALDNVNAGNIHISIAQCSRIWASLPGNHYGQHVNEMPYLCEQFINSGGKVASA